MSPFDKTLTVFALVLAGGVGLAACGDGGPDDPEADHCARAAARLTRSDGPISVTEAKAWTTDDVRSVQVRFAYAENNPAGLSYGNIQCTYAFPVTVRGDAKRLPQAQSLYFRNRNLSENELLLLNMNLRGTKSDF